jgi:hypothetical protein
MRLGGIHRTQVGHFSIVKPITSYKDSELLNGVISGSPFSSEKPTPDLQELVSSPFLKKSEVEYRTKLLKL